ncbi:SCP-like protein [Oesophagostomum dentatum]|uniref:SCP-like protein n=1 Tax=Oesophagostomum dentatum TaxID=61180 RepID=A0A0B1TN79_OESDE|nr:SCP-like protein [Oesophagostomum dentatum]
MFWCKYAFCSTLDAAYCAHGRAGEDEIRDEVLAPVNAERQLVSSGGRQNGRTGTNLPAARSMLDLVWSCSLEMEAISILNNASCEFHPSSLPADKAYIYVSDYTYEEGFDFVIKPHISRIVEDELTVITADEVKYNDESMLKSYASLIRETTTVIACAKLECPTLLHAFLCLTDEP